MSSWLWMEIGSWRALKRNCVNFMTTKWYQKWQVKDQVITEDTDLTKRRYVTEAGVIVQNLIPNVVIMAVQWRSPFINTKTDVQRTGAMKFMLVPLQRNTQNHVPKVFHQAALPAILFLIQRMRRQWPPNNGAVQTPLGAAKNKTEKEGENVDTAEKPHMVKTKKPVNDPQKKLF